MKKYLKKVIILTSVLLGLYTVTNAQTIYRSTGSGFWSTVALWEKSTDNGATWSAATAAPTSNQSVTIRATHTITLDASKSCLGLTIEAGARLSTGAGSFSIRPGTASTGTSGIITVLQNDGILGGVGELMVLELPLTCAQLTITGAGSCEIGRIRALTGNTNYPASITTGHLNDARLIVDQNIKLNTDANYVFSEPNSTVAATDVFIFTINAGKTVTSSAPGGKWENTLMAPGGVTAGGSYTYNVNGTLDLSANTTGNSSFIPYANTSSSIVVNISGLLKLGSSFKADTVNTSLGAISLNLLNTGVLDASQTTSYRVGKKPDGSGTAGAVKDLVFGMDPGTSIKQTVGATQVKFPVGLPGNPTSNTAYVTNAGTPDIFSVAIKGTIDNAPPNANVVNRQWTISEAVAGGTVGTISLSWTSADQAAGFNPASAISILRWTGSAYEAHGGTISGTGTANDPYVATASGFTAFSPFIVANFVALPISFDNAKAYQKNNGIQIDWSISSEHANKYVVEKSADGNLFSQLTVVNAQAGNALVNNYTTFDANPLRGNNFYRIKSIDLDGSIKYSAIMRVTISGGKPSLVVSPNPVIGNQMNLQVTNMTKGIYTLIMYNTSGQKVYSGQVISEGGSFSQSVQLPGGIASGNYTLQFTNGSDVRLTLPVIKQ